MPMGQFIYILDSSNFDLVSLLLTLEATELVSEPVIQIAVELIDNHLISVQQKDECKSYIFLCLKTKF